MTASIKEKKSRLFVVAKSLCSTIERLFRDLQQRQISVEVMPVNDGNGDLTGHGGTELPAPQEAAGIPVRCFL